jgi:hypothetical protein
MPSFIANYLTINSAGYKGLGEMNPQEFAV